MVKVKRRMTKEDVEAEISDSFIRNYNALKIVGKEKPDSVQRVMATIQDTDYYGAGKYNVVFDIFGTIVEDNGDLRENVRYQTNCHVIVTASDEGEPIANIEEQIILTKSVI